MFSKVKWLQLDLNNFYEIQRQNNDVLHHLNLVYTRLKHVTDELQKKEFFQKYLSLTKSLKARIAQIDLFISANEGGRNFYKKIINQKMNELCNSKK